MHVSHDAPPPSGLMETWSSIYMLPACCLLLFAAAACCCLLLLAAACCCLLLLADAAIYDGVGGTTAPGISGRMTR